MISDTCSCKSAQDQQHDCNAATAAILYALNEAIDSNNLATIQLRNQDYSEAKETLGNTLAKLKKAAQSFRSQKVTSMVRFGVHCHWDSRVDDSNQGESSFLPMLQGPLILCAFETPKQERGDSSLLTIEYAIVLTSLCLVGNLGMCYHALGDRLLRDGKDLDGSMELLQKSVRLYECSRKLAVSLKQPVHPVELILLNNLGQACLRLHQQEQANQWFQELSIASTQFSRMNKLYQVDEGIRSLVDSFVSNFVAVAFGIFPIAAPAA